MKTIDIFTLKDISYVPSARTCDAYAEAAAVCLENQGHQSNTIFFIESDKVENVALEWTTINQKIKDNWLDLQEATEYGATCLAIWAVHETTTYKVTRRSSKLTGFDYWLGDKEDNYPFQDKARLEISGILKGTKSQIKQRLKDKLKQTDKSDFLNLPAVVVIVDFSKPLAKIELKNE